MRSRGFLVIPLTLITIVLCGCVSLMPIDTSPQECDPALESLMIDDSAFPADWVTGESYESDEHRYLSIEQCSRSFYIVNGLARQELHQYANETDAIGGYQQRLADNFSSVDAEGNIPLGIQFESTADDSISECYFSGTLCICEVLARYNTIIMIFSTHMSPDFMTDDDLFRVLQAIDDKLTQSKNAP